MHKLIKYFIDNLDFKVRYLGDDTCEVATNFLGQQHILVCHELLIDYTKEKMIQGMIIEIARQVKDEPYEFTCINPNTHQLETNRLTWEKIRNE